MQQIKFWMCISMRLEVRKYTLTWSTSSFCSFLKPIVPELYYFTRLESLQPVLCAFCTSEKTSRLELFLPFLVTYLPPAELTCSASVSMLLLSCLCHFLFYFPDLQLHFTSKLLFMAEWKCMHFVKHFLISASASVYSFLWVFIAVSVRIHSEKPSMPVVYQR